VITNIIRDMGKSGMCNPPLSCPPRLVGAQDPHWRRAKAFRRNAPPLLVTVLTSQCVCFAGLHRAAGFTRRYQSASGLLKDECHERWDARRLPESLRIESIRREILPFPDEQQQKEQENPTADGKKQSRVELREQKRTAGAAIAMAAGQQSRSRSRTPGGGDTPLPPLTPIRVKLRTSERASLRAERLHEMFTDEKPEDGADDGADDGVGDGAGNGVAFTDKPANSYSIA